MLQKSESYDILEIITRVVCGDFLIDEDSLAFNGRPCVRDRPQSQIYTKAKQLCMYLAEEITGESKSHIALYYRRHPSVGHHSAQVIKECMETNKYFKSRVDNIRKNIWHEYENNTRTGTISHG